MNQVYNGNVPQSAKNESNKKKRQEFSYEIDGDPDQYDEDKNEDDKL